eukprot:8211-Prymnesium_polylepis.1
MRECAFVLPACTVCAVWPRCAWSVACRCVMLGCDLGVWHTRDQRKNSDGRLLCADRTGHVKTEVHRFPRSTLYNIRSEIVRLHATLQCPETRLQCPPDHGGVVGF